MSNNFLAIRNKVTGLFLKSYEKNLWTDNVTNSIIIPFTEDYSSTKRLDRNFTDPNLEIVEYSIYPTSEKLLIEILGGAAKVTGSLPYELIDYDNINSLMSNNPNFPTKENDENV